MTKNIVNNSNYIQLFLSFSFFLLLLLLFSFFLLLFPFFLFLFSFFLLLCPLDLILLWHLFHLYVSFFSFNWKCKSNQLHIYTVAIQSHSIDCAMVKLSRIYIYIYMCERIWEKGPLCPRMLLPIQPKIRKDILKIVLLHHH